MIKLRSNYEQIVPSILLPLLIVISFNCLLPVDSLLYKLIGRDSAKEARIENPSYGRQQLIVNSFKQVDDIALTCGQFIHSRGFDHEIHWVTTEDGYILQNYRMWSKYAKQSLGRLKPILLIHGLLYSGSSWFMHSDDGYILPWGQNHPPNDTSNGLAFHLANRGYEVWLLNNRGTTYSTNHTKYNPKSNAKFWEYSFYEMGIYDLPATTNYIKKFTGFDKITLIGYSQGTMQTFVKLSLDPSYASNYDVTILAAPIAFLGNMKGLVSLFPRQPISFRSLDILRSLRIPTSLATLAASLTILCQSESNLPTCLATMGSVVGPNEAQLNYTRLPVYLSEIDTTSGKNLLHYLQTMYHDQVHFYDYGSVENVMRYGSIRPPKIPLSNYPTDKLVLISGLNDYLSTPEDIQKLRKTLKGTPLVDHVISDPLWNHLDFQIAKDGFNCFTSVIDKVLNNLSKTTTNLIK